MWVLKTGRMTFEGDIQKSPHASVLLAALVYPTFERTDYEAIERGLWKINLKRIKRKVKVCVSKEGQAILWTTV